jgi:hypothetical protein
LCLHLSDLLSIPPLFASATAAFFCVYDPGLPLFGALHARLQRKYLSSHTP